MYRRGTNLEYRVFGPKDYVVNVCSFLNGTWTHVMAQWVFDYLKKVSRETNILHPCPFSVRGIQFFCPNIWNKIEIYQNYF